MSSKGPGHSGLARTTLAVVLAYALALQALLTGLGSGQHAVRANDLAAALGAICAPGAADGSLQGGPAPIPTHDEGGTSLCCLLGCGSSPLPGLTVARASGPANPGLSAQLRLPSAYSTPDLDQIGVRPVGARAPPVLA